MSEHGALGHYLQKKKKMKGRLDPRFKKFKKPLRLTFGEQHKVKDIAAGFGFSAFSVKSNGQNKVFGTGLNTDSQIGEFLWEKYFIKKFHTNNIKFVLIFLKDFNLPERIVI